MDFREVLVNTLRALRPVLEVPGVLVVGSEVPNLLERRAASTLVISRDVDIGVAVGSHSAVKSRLVEVKELRPSGDEPSVWVPETEAMIEVNFVGYDPAISDASESYVLEDSVLPLLVFGNLSFLRPGAPIEVEGLLVPVPRAAGLLMEKLVTERGGEKGDRDLLVVMGMLLVASPVDLDEFEEIYGGLDPYLRACVRSNLSILSLMDPHPGMPDPRPYRDRLARLMERLERHRAPA